MSRLGKIIFTAFAVALLVPVYAYSRQELPTPKSGVGIAVFSDEGQQAAFEVPIKKSYPDGPHVIVWQVNLPQRWVKSSQQPRTKDGRLVSGFKFAGWMEGGSAKIIVTALINGRSKERPSTNEQELEEQFVETYLAKPGNTILVSGMSQYGVKPLELRMMRANSLFPSKPTSTEGKRIGK